LERESFRRILREELNMRKVCAKMVPKLLADEQKERGKELCLDLLQRNENEPDLLNSTITSDETWVFTYAPETKRQSMQWKSTSSPRPKKKKKKKSRHQSFEVQGHVDYFLRYPGYCDGRVGTQRPDGKSAVLH